MSVQAPPDYSKLDNLQLSRLVATRLMNMPELTEEEMAKLADAHWKAQAPNTRLAPAFRLGDCRFRARRVWEEEGRRWAVYAEQDFPHFATHNDDALRVAEAMALMGFAWEINLTSRGVWVELHGPNPVPGGRRSKLLGAGAPKLPAAICQAALMALDMTRAPG